MFEMNEREPNWIKLECLRDSVFEGIVRYKKGETYKADVLNKNSAKVIGEKGYEVFFIGTTQHWMGNTFAPISETEAE